MPVADFLNDVWYDKLAARLRAVRLHAGKTIAQLAAEAGVNVDELAQFERYEREPNLRHLRRLSHALGVPVHKLCDVGGSLPRISPPESEPWVWRVVDKTEKRILHLFRMVSARERLVVDMLIQAMIISRTPRHLQRKVQDELEHLKVTPDGRRKPPEKVVSSPTS